MNYPHLLSASKLNTLNLQNRLFMAPMTRSRANEKGIPRPTTATYYSQRASAGLIVSEAINISEDAVGSPLTPGIYTSEQVNAWKDITSAVHQKGGKIFAQLWHTGRVGHSVVRNGKKPVAPSAIAIEGQQHFTLDGMLDYEVPRALSIQEIREIVQDYRQAALNAIEAGFDGVELHAAFGYLPNQFLVDSANIRTDEYGGSVENRSRFVLETMTQMIDAIGANRVGIKLSPTIPFNSMIDSDPVALFEYLIAQLNQLHPAYVHLMQSLFPTTDFPHWPTDPLKAFGKLINSPIITNGGYNAESAETVLAEGRADFVSIGTAFVANPDLPYRFAVNGDLAEVDKTTLYGGEDAGYIDYPSLQDKSQEVA